MKWLRAANGSALFMYLPFYSKAVKSRKLHEIFVFQKAEFHQSGDKKNEFSLMVFTTGKKKKLKLQVMEAMPFHIHYRNLAH